MFAVPQSRRVNAVTTIETRERPTSDSSMHVSVPDHDIDLSLSSAGEPHDSKND
jgi:hypothetical protein